MQRQYILAATKYPRRLCRSRQNFLGYFVAATESPSDKINCDTGPVSPSNSKQVHFWQGKKVDPVQFRCQSRQVHFWQGKKVDPVQFRCQNPSRSIFGRGKKWTRSSFAVEIQAGPFLAGENSGPGPVLLLKFRQVQWTWL